MKLLGQKIKLRSSFTLFECYAGTSGPHWCGVEALNEFGDHSLFSHSSHPQVSFLRSVPRGYTSASIEFHRPREGFSKMC